MQSVAAAAAATNVSSKLFLQETTFSETQNSQESEIHDQGEHPIYLLWSSTSAGLNETLEALLLNSSQLFYSLLQGNNGQLSVDEDYRVTTSNNNNNNNFYDQYGGSPSVSALLLPSENDISSSSTSSLAAKVTSTTLQLAASTVLQNVSGQGGGLAESEERQRELEEVLGQVRDSTPTVVLMTVVYALILAIGVSGNALTCLVIARQRYMHTATNFYLFSLAVSDFLFLILGIPNEIVLLWQR